ncbi:MAG: transcription elongation factor GreA [Actinobacteria bacterium]|nr:transcription elongation factor GreA [Planctomycetota bacterium]MBU4403343.1 transcription elongation factor GreA [Actinomycetota bacterium]MCG2819729.1 transcription elongation factor GreA [Actinomycetes bacterium]
MEHEPVLTSEGMQALEEKLQHLETTRRREVSEQMKNAIDHGDLSENAEYDEARNAYLKLEKQINETATLIARARVIGENDISTESVGVGSLVQIEDVENDSNKKKFRLVGPTESNPENGKISHLCPIGMSLMNSKLGDIVSVNTPGGIKKYKVITIAK